MPTKFQNQGASWESWVSGPLSDGVHVGVEAILDWIYERSDDSHEADDLVANFPESVELWLCSGEPDTTAIDDMETFEKANVWGEELLERWRREDVGQIEQWRWTQEQEDILRVQVKGEAIYQLALKYSGGDDREDAMRRARAWMETAEDWLGTNPGAVIRDLVEWNEVVGGAEAMIAPE